MKDQFPIRLFFHLASRFYECYRLLVCDLSNVAGDQVTISLRPSQWHKPIFLSLNVVAPTAKVFWRKILWQPVCLSETTIAQLGASVSTARRTVGFIATVAELAIFRFRPSKDLTTRGVSGKMVIYVKACLFQKLRLLRGE